MPFAFRSTPTLPAPATAVFTVAVLTACAESGGDMNPPQESISDGTTDLKANVEVAVFAGPGVLGLTPQDGVADGWTITLDKLLVTVGNVTFTDANGSTTTHQEDAVVDLLQLTAAAGPLASVEVPAGALQVRFSVPNATDRFTPFETTAPADRDLMAMGGWSTYVEGRIEKQGGLTCSAGKVPLCTPAPVVSFRWGFAAGATYTGCPDLQLDPDAELPAILTLSGDRWFLPGFTDGGAAPPTWRAQWLANADLDRDGETTLDELAQIKATTLFDRAHGYDFAGAPILIVTARDFVQAQARTIGRHALGLCPTSVGL